MKILHARRYRRITCVYVEFLDWQMDTIFFQHPSPWTTFSYVLPFCPRRNLKSNIARSTGHLWRTSRNFVEIWFQRKIGKYRFCLPTLFHALFVEHIRSETDFLWNEALWRWVFTEQSSIQHFSDWNFVQWSFFLVNLRNFRMPSRMQQEEKWSKQWSSRATTVLRQFKSQFDSFFLVFS